MTNSLIGTIDLDLEYQPEGTVTIEVKRDRLTNLVRKENLPLLEFLETQPRYRGLFPDESEEDAILAPIQRSSDEEQKKMDSAPAFLRLPKDWRLRGFPRSYYITNEKEEEPNQMPVDEISPFEGLPPGWERRSLMHEGVKKVYYVDHNTRTTSWNAPGKPL